MLMQKYFVDLFGATFAVVKVACSVSLESLQEKSAPSAIGGSFNRLFSNGISPGIYFRLAKAFQNSINNMEEIIKKNTTNAHS